MSTPTTPATPDTPSEAGAGGAGQVPAGYVKVDDINKLKSVYDKRIAEMSKQLEQSAQEAALRGLEPDEAAQVRMQQLEQRIAQYEQKEQEQVIRQQLAERMAERANIDASAIAHIQDPVEMMERAIELRLSGTQAAASPQVVQPQVPTHPTPPVYGSGATLTEAPKPVDPVEARKDALSTRNVDAFMDTILPRQDE